MLLSLVELFERALMPSVFRYIPTEHLDTEQVPSMTFTGIVPAHGGTLMERPALVMSPIGIRGREVELPDDILEGFEVTVKEGQKVIIGKGKYRKDGEVREFGGAEIEISEGHFVAFNLLTERVEVTSFLSPFHRVLKRNL